MFNFICFVVLYSVIKTIETNLIQFNFSLGEQAQIYTSLLATIVAIIYLDHIFNDSIEYKKIKMSKIGKIISTVFILSVTYSFFIMLTNMLNPISCDPTTNENVQANKNTQSSDTPNNSNEQLNGNNQYLNNSKTSNSKNNNDNPVQTNKQDNINIQNYTTKSKLIHFNGKILNPHLTKDRKSVV